MSGQKREPHLESFGYWLFRVHRAMNAAFIRRLAVLGVTGAEWSILGRADVGGVTPVALARHLGVDQAAVTRFVDQLEVKGLVQRTAHPTDRRSTLIVLTATGEALLPKLIAASKETNREFLAVLSPDEVRPLFTLIRKLGERLPEQVFPVEPRDS